MRDVQLMQGAGVVAGACAGVRPGERVLVVADYLTESVARVLAEACAERGGEVCVLFMPPRAIDNQEPPAGVTAAMGHADVLLLPVSKSLSHTRAVRAAVAGGARALSLAAFTEELLRSRAMAVDFAAMKPTCERAARAFTEGRTARVTTARGMDLTVSLEGRRGNAHACIVGPGQFSAVPNIEANVSPVEGTAEGVIMADGSVPYYGIGVLREPVTFEVARGMVTAIRGGEQARALRDLLAAQDDPAVYNVAQLAIGLNPHCTEMTGVMLNDEGVYGTAHVGIGTSSSLGGHTQAKTHFDALIWNPCVAVDGRVILRDGQLLI